MKQKRRIWPWILLTVVVLLGGVLFWQRDNLRALYLYRTQTAEELAQAAFSAQQQESEALQEYHVTVQDLTPEEEKQLVQGTLTPQDVQNRLVSEAGDGSGEAPPPVEKVPQSSAGQSASKAVDEIVNRYVAQAYSLKAAYLGKLGTLYSSAVGEYSALPKDQRTASKKKEIAMSYSWEASCDESDCDAEMKTLLDRMKQELKEAGADTSVVDTIRQAYRDQKAGKKAYYLSLIES